MDYGMTSLPMKLQKCLDDLVDDKKIFGATVSLSSERHGFQWSGGSGNLSPDSSYFIASTTKLYVTALILMLKTRARLSLTDAISKYLPSDVMAGLHLRNGRDHSSEVTVAQLLSHTSGIPDYFQTKPLRGKSLEDRITRGEDQSWTFEQAVDLAKRLKPKFTPGAQGKAHYSDTNFQLLGRIVETLENKPLARVLEENIFAPLNLLRTYMYTDPSDSSPMHLYFGREPLHVPKAMASFKADGGIVSTAEENRRFLEAFFKGGLFPKAELADLQRWNPIFFPLQAGTGFLRFKLPWFFSPFREMPELIGHSGLSGAFAFYCPVSDVFLAGTVNQIRWPGTSFRLMLKLIDAL